MAIIIPNHALKLGPRSHRPPCILFTYTVGTIELLHNKTSLFPTPAASVFVEQSLSKSVLMAFASLSLEVKGLATCRFSVELGLLYRLRS